MNLHQAQARMAKPFKVMSVWKREIFKWNRSDSEKDKKYAPEMQPLIKLGSVDPSNADLNQLHSASMHGRRKEILEVLQKGIWVDFPNDAGQTALFCATLRGHYATAELLLQNGANPNEKSDTGITPVHVACLKAVLRVLGAMIEAGGDLRLHDNEGNGCIDWARFHPDPRKRMKMLEFLQKSQLFALNYSGDFVAHANSLDRQPSILQMLRGKVGSQMSLDFAQETGLRRVHSHGYGRVYYGGDATNGVVSVIPLFTENQLQHDGDGISFDCGIGFTMTGMLWNMTSITIKQQNKQMKGHHSVDLLISEVEHLSKLRHPNILLLMGLCQSSSFDKVMLAFERVSIGSLYYILHEKIDHLPMTYIRDICGQVCQALLYIQGQNYIHCCLTSHAVFMVSMHQAKVGNLEYMVEMKKASTGRTCLVSTSPHIEHVYRWMAPEILMGDPPTAASDVYSFCCVLWEMVTSELPWKSKSVREVQKLHKSNSAQLPSPPKSVALFQTIIEEGLKPDSKNRPQDFVTVFGWLQGPLDKPSGWKPNTLDRLKSLQKESKERIAISSRLGTVYEVSTSRSILEDPSTSGQQSAASSGASSSATLLVPLISSSQTHSVTAKQSESGNFSDSTNNHCSTNQQKSADTSNSCSTADNSNDGLDTESAECHSSIGDSNKYPHSRKRFLVQSAGQLGTHHPERDIDMPAEKTFDRSCSLSAVQSVQKYSRRTASLPWQGSQGLLRAGSTSPRVSRSPQGHHDREVNKDSDSFECSSKVVPPVKPASHSIDVKDFVRDSAVATSVQALDIISRRSRRLSPRRSLPRSRNCPFVFSRVFPRSKSASGDVLESSEKDVELSVPGSVRTLTEQFQAQLFNHSLRQSILKGSMTPQGSLFPDLDTSPICLKQSPNISEVPPEGNREKDTENQDREVLTGSSKGSTESLTSVSFREDSISDEDEEHGFPLSSRNELDITSETTMPKPTPVYPPYPAHFQCQPAKPRSGRLFQESGAFRKISSKQVQTEFDCTDRNPGANTKPQKKSQFLPSSLPGTDISTHPFDFQDYYIDDDYTGASNDDPSRLDSPKSRTCEATHITDRSRQRIRNRVWLGDNKKNWNKRNRHSEKKADEDIRENQWISEQRAAEGDWKECQDKEKQITSKRITELNKDEPFADRKENQCLEGQWRRKDKDTKRETDDDYPQRVTEKSKEGEGNPEPRKEEDGNKERDITSGSPLIIEACQEDERTKTGSHKGRSSAWHADTETESQRDSDQARERCEDNQSRESLWEDFVMRSPKNLMAEVKDYRAESLATTEKRQDDHNPKEIQEYEDRRQYTPGFRFSNEDLFAIADNPNDLDQIGNSDDHLIAEEDETLLADSSMNTVVERPVKARMYQSVCVSDEEDDDNDTTLIEDDVAEQPRCILLNLERNTLSQEELQDVVDASPCQGSATENLSPKTSSSRRPLRSSPPQSTLRKFYLGSSTGSQGYSTTLRVESSLQKPGSHRITQTARDTSTGVTQTVHEETVQAETLRTTMAIK